MDVTDFAIGIVLIFIIAWVSIIALNQDVVRSDIADLYVLTAIGRPLISEEDACPQQAGFELVKPDKTEMQPYHVIAGINDFNQTYFCFYKEA